MLGFKFGFRFLGHCYPSSRIDQVSLHLAPGQLHNGNMCLSFHTQNTGCKRKLYKVPSAISYCHVLRPSASPGSIELDGTTKGNQTSPSTLSPDNVQSRQLYHSGSPPVDIADFERQLQELFSEVKNLIRVGSKDDAINLLQANYESVKEQIATGARGIEEAAILDVLALGYIATGDFKRLSSLLDVLDDVVGYLKDDEPLLDSILTHMGSMYSTMGKFEKSMLMYGRSLVILEGEYGKSSIFLVTPLLGMAKVLGATSRTTEAVEVYYRVIRVLELHKGGESEDLVVPLLGLGNLLMKVGKAGDAENSFLRILDIYTKLYGENDGRVGMAMCSLAHVKCAKGNVDEAIRLYRDALQVLKASKSMALDDNILEKMRIDLAELLHSVGRGKEGRELLEECLFITQKYKGKEHPSLVTHLINLATSYSGSKSFVEADRLLRTSLHIITKTADPDDPSITFPMLHLAVNLYNLHQFTEAEQLAQEAVCIREKAFGKESLPVGEALDCLVSIQSKLEKDDAELLENLKRVLAIQEKAFGYESEEVMQTLKKVLFYLDKMGLKNEKFPLQRRLSILRTKYKHMIR
ncbi:hypothetical protein NMG60_11020132 [Bertholletia excelsa]